MNRFFLKSIFYSFVCLYLVAYEGNPKSLASTKQEKQATSSDDMTNAQKPGLNSSKSKVKNSNTHFELVPPPPPEQPSFLNLRNMPDLSTSFLLFNETELKQKLSHLKVEILNAQDTLNESNMQLHEATEKSEHINSLKDADQIFSRKELEAQKRSLLHREHLAAEAKNNLEDLQLQENAILRRLAESKKGAKGSTPASKKKMVKNEKHK